MKQSKPSALAVVMVTQIKQWNLTAETVCESLTNLQF
jgi:hypothetical protein